jgi:hypothetical protein
MTENCHPLDALFDLAGETVHALTAELVTDVDGGPAGVTLLDETGVLVLPDPAVWAKWQERGTDG